MLAESCAVCSCYIRYRSTPPCNEQRKRDVERLKPHPTTRRSTARQQQAVTRQLSKSRHPQRGTSASGDCVPRSRPQQHAHTRYLKSGPESRNLTTHISHVEPERAQRTTLGLRSPERTLDILPALKSRHDRLETAWNRGGVQDLVGEDVARGPGGASRFRRPGGASRLLIGEALDLILVVHFVDGSAHGDETRKA